MSDRDAPKAERLAEFLRRLGIAPAAANFEEAYRQVCNILNGVEDEMTSIPFDPSQWMIDGRLYPFQLDREVSPSRIAGAREFHSLKHDTFIGVNGAIEIWVRSSGATVLAKPGADGRTLS